MSHFTCSPSVIMNNPFYILESVSVCIVNYMVTLVLSHCHHFLMWKKKNGGKRTRSKERKKEKVPRKEGLTPKISAF